MRIEVHDPTHIPALRLYLQRNGCPSEQTAADKIEVRVLWPEGALRSETLDRTKVFTMLREWCADNPGARATLLA